MNEALLSAIPSLSIIGTINVVPKASACEIFLLLTAETTVRNFHYRYESKWKPQRGGKCLYKSALLYNGVTRGGEGVTKKRGWKGVSASGRKNQTFEGKYTLKWM